MEILSNRSFENKSIKQLSSSYKFLVAGVPDFNHYFIYKNLSKGYRFDDSKPESILIINKQNDTNKGIITKTNDGFEIQLSIYSNDNPKIMRFFGMESILKNYNINAIYSANKVSSCNLNNLIYFKEIRTYTIKKKKNDDYTKIDAIHEFFLLEKEYVNEISTKNLSNFYTFITPSNYNDNYWQEVENKIFQPLPKSLELYIKEKLTEIK
ncbi:hypothetical protein [Flavobacterium psychrotolerans]|nr:hypothetical protein [Flavobacterium psychrotolerans]